MSASTVTSYVVTGPNCEHRAVPAQGAALIYAQRLALDADDAGTWYVRRPDGQIGWHVSREESGVVLTHTLGASS